MACRGSGVQIPSAPLNIMKYLIQILKESKLLLASQVLIAIILILQVSIVTKGLGLDQYGELAILVTFISLIFRILHSKNNDVTLVALKTSHTSIFFQSFFFDVILGLIGTVILYIVFNLNFLNYFEDVSKLKYLTFFIATKALLLTVETSKAHFTYFKKFNFLSLLEFLNIGIRFIIIYFVFSFNASLNYYFLANSIANLIIFICNIFLSYSYLNFTKISFTTIKNYFSLIVNQYKKQRIDQIAGIFSQHFDILILGYFADVSAVGLYRIAKRLVEPINFLINSLIPIIQNKLLNNMKSHFNFNEFVKKFLMPTSFFIFMFLFLFGKNLLYLISGSDYVNAYSVLLTLLIGQLIYLNTFWIRITFLFNNLIEKHAISRGINTIVFAILSFLLAPNFSAIGIAISISIAIFIQKLYEYLIYRKIIYNH